MKHSILVLDDLFMVRDALARELSDAGFDVTCTTTSAEALGKLQRAGFDLLLLDLRACKPDRIELLRTLRRNARTSALPVIALVCNGDKQQILKAARLGVRECLLKSSVRPQDLLPRIRRCLAPHSPVPPAATHDPAVPATAEAASSVERALTREQTLRRLKSVDMPSLSAAVGDLLSYVTSPRASVGDIAGSLKKDPALAARVLRIANSAAFVSARAKIVVIDDAIRHIGTSTVRNLVTSLSVFDAIGGAASGESMHAWKHCLAVATVMERLASEGDACVPGVAYLVGLCHDLPELMLRRYFPQQHAAILARPSKHGRADAAAYVEMFGIPYRELVGHLLARFELPAAITDPIREFHVHPSNEISSGSALARLLGLAHFCVNGILLSMGPDQPVRPIADAEFRAVLNADVPKVDLLDLRDATILTCSLISGTTQGADQAAAPLQRRIVYLREASTSIDPLHALLTLMATEVVVWDPASPPPAGADAIVVGGRGAQAVAALRQMARSLVPLPPILWPENGTQDLPADLAGAIVPVEHAVTAETVQQLLASPCGGCGEAVAA